MAYISPDDFRKGQLKWYTRNMDLTSEEAPDSDLVGAISAMSDFFDVQTGDHFEAETGVTFSIDGSGLPIQMLSKRVRSIATVETQDNQGVYTVEDPAVYRVTGSLVGGTRAEGDLDLIEITSGQLLSNGSAVWPLGNQTLRITGDFSWLQVPEMVKRAIALMTFDVVKGTNENIRRASQWSTNQATYTRAPESPTGLPEVDQIITDFTIQRLSVL